MTTNTITTHKQDTQKKTIKNKLNKKPDKAGLPQRQISLIFPFPLLDLFFLIFAILTTSQFLAKIDNNNSNSNHKKKEENEVAVFSFRFVRRLLARALHLQSVVLLAILLVWRDVGIENRKTLVPTLFFYNNYYGFTQQVYAVTWSNAIIMQMSLFLPLFLYLVWKLGAISHLYLISIIGFLLSTFVRVYEIFSRYSSSNLHFQDGLPCMALLLSEEAKNNLKAGMGIEKFAFEGDPLYQVFHPRFDSLVYSVLVVFAVLALCLFS